MKHKEFPNPNAVHPVIGYEKEIYVKPSIYYIGNLPTFFIFRYATACKINRDFTNSSSVECNSFLMA